MAVVKLFKNLPDAVLEPEFPNRQNGSKENLNAAYQLHRTRGLRVALSSALGSLPAALILEQILYWHCPDKHGKCKLRVWAKGILWLAKSRQEMMEETGVTLKQYRTAIPALQKAGLIDYRIGGFAGKPTPFIQLNTPKLYALIAPNGLEPLGPKGTNVWALRAQTNTGILSGTTTGNTLLLTQEPPLINTDVQPGEAEMLKKNPTTGKHPKVPTNVKTILSASAKDVKELTSESMYKVWAITTPKHNPDVKFVGPFTQMQKGQMNTLSKTWGKDAQTVLIFVLSNWIKFCKHVAATMGTKAYPEVPSTSYLTKHRDLAMNFYLSKQSSEKPVQLIAPKPVEAPKPQKPAPQVEDEDKPITLEELLALSKGV